MIGIIIASPQLAADMSCGTTHPLQQKINYFLNENENSLALAIDTMHGTSAAADTITALHDSKMEAVFPSDN